MQTFAYKLLQTCESRGRIKVRQNWSWRMSTVVCRGYLHLLLCFAVQQPETQTGDRDLKGIAKSQEVTTRGLSIKFKH